MLQTASEILMSVTQPAKLDLNKKSLPKQKTIQNFTIDAQGFRKTKNENQCWPICQAWADRPALVCW